MADHDRNDLIVRALRNLGALPQGQSPNAEETQSLDDLIDPMMADLIARDVNLIAINPDAIDNQYFLPLGHLLAWAAAPEFGQAENQGLAALAEQSELKLKKITAMALFPYTRKIAEGQYY